jgi:hypothetical protein
MPHEKRASKGSGERRHYLTSKSCQIRPHFHRRRAPALLPSRPISCGEAFSSLAFAEKGKKNGRSPKICHVTLLKKYVFACHVSFTTQFFLYYQNIVIFQTAGLASSIHNKQNKV